MKTPVGETKMPDPTIVPIMMPTPFNNVILRSKTMRCSVFGDDAEPFNLSTTDAFGLSSLLLSFKTPVSLLFSLFFSLDMIQLKYAHTHINKYKYEHKYVYEYNIVVND